jgi:23S rRNA (pseudouridine1915-N3)-methyltransferase
LKLRLAAVGKVKSKPFAAACADYEKRLRRYAKFELIEVKDVRGRSVPECQLRESDSLQGAVLKGSRVVLLDESGELLTSRELAARMDRDAQTGNGSWTLLIGGSDGHSAALKAQAQFTWSLSPLTLPHELARVVVLEQLYRALTIRKGESYHRD